MSNTLNDTFETAKNVIASANGGAHQATGTAKHAYASAKHSADHAVSGARTTWLDGVKVVSGIVAMLRSLQASDALGWVGLSRRRNPITSFGIFSAGVAVGAGASMLFAPMSGSAMRREIMKRISSLSGIAQRVESEAKNVEAKVEQVASKVTDTAASGAAELKDAAATKVDSAKMASENGKLHHPS